MKQEDISVNERYPTLDVNNKLIWNIRDIGHTMRQLFEGKGSQKRVLMMLRENPGLTQRALTERLGVQPGSASEVVGKLEVAGLLERETSAEDRRTAVLHLTGAGAQAVSTKSSHTENCTSSPSASASARARAVRRACRASRSSP